MYIFFGFECTQDTLVECDEGYLPEGNGINCINCNKAWCGSMGHKPNLCVAVCSLCMNKDIDFDSECVNRGPNEKVFSVPNTITLFCQWLFF